MNTLGVTGPRHLTEDQREQALWELDALTRCRTWHIGDATGLDQLACYVAQRNGVITELHQKNPQLAWRVQGAERSTRMIKALALAGGALHAWPNKPAPEGLHPAKTWPKNAAGSGTWGTIALAVGLGLPVQLHPLAELGELPEWLQQRQLSLL